MLKCRLVKYYLVFASLVATVACAAPEGKRLIERSCNRGTPCHSQDIIFKKNFSKEQWSSVVKSMIAKGADLKPAEEKIIVEYLADNYGKK